MWLIVARVADSGFDIPNKTNDIPNSEPFKRLDWTVVYGGLLWAAGFSGDGLGRYSDNDIKICLYPHPTLSQFCFILSLPYPKPQWV
jgi:hypothetical protein